MSDSDSVKGIGLCNILFVIFLVLKLTDQIDWSWWWITIPLWGPWVLVASILLFVVLIGVILEIFKGM